MGIIAIPFAVSLEKVKSVFGSKDAALLEQIKTTDLYLHYAEPADFIDEDYKYDLDKMLYEIIFNYAPTPQKERTGGLFGISNFAMRTNWS